MLGDSAISEFAISEFATVIDIPPILGKYRICGEVFIRCAEGETLIQTPEGETYLGVC